MAAHDLIWRFTPSRTDLAVLDEIFVQRHQLMADIVERVRESAFTGNKHQVLLIGPRGIGKTHLITLMHHRITQDPELHEKVRIAWLLEDETTTSFVQLLKRIYELLAEAYPVEFRTDWLSGLLDRSPPQIQKALESDLVEKLSGKLLLLFVENLDAMFDNLGDEGQKQLRAFLQTYPLTSIVATSQRLFQGVRNRDQAFFGFFALEHLRPLCVSDAVELLRNVACHQQQTDLVAYLTTPEGRSRVRALHHLAGGNHRIYIVLSGFITRESLDELAGPFEKMVDELTPYYQERMRWLAPQQRQIIEYLCTTDETCTPKEIARHLLATENTVSSQLKKLLELGYVLRSPRGRESLYELAEPLMRLANEVKEKRHKPIRLLVNFLRLWYRPEVSRFEALIGQGRENDGLVELSKAHIQPYPPELKDIADLLLNVNDLSEDVRHNIAERITVCAGNDVLASLGDGLVRSLRWVEAMRLSRQVLGSWRDAWTDFGATHLELEIPLRIFRVGINYLIEQDERVLLNLISVERKIVRQVLGLDAADGKE